jgi:hypothetical protein
MVPALESLLSFSKCTALSFLAALMMFAAPSPADAEEPSPAAESGFDSYIRQVEARLDRQHRAPETFLAPEDSARLRKGELIIEKLTPPSHADLPGALLHHWRGTGFAPGATAADFDRLMKNFKAYPEHFSPEVVRSRAVTEQDDHFQVTMRVRQHHVITVVLDIASDVTFGRLDSQHEYSVARSTKISEIKSPGTPSERTLSPAEQHGFLWRLYTYWSYEEKDGGLYMQIESVSLTRSIPNGLGWVIRPFVESIPRESLEFTLRSAREALRK